jgi:hypothetical protein
MADNNYINFPQLQGYGSRNRGSLSFKPLSFSELVEFVNPSSFFADQAQAAQDYNANAGNRNPLQYDIQGTELADDSTTLMAQMMSKVKEPTSSQINQLYTYDPSDIDNVDYFGRPPSTGPDLSYRPEDMYPGEPVDTSFLGFLKRNYKDYIKGAAKAGLKAATKTDKAPKQPQPISSVRGGNISYAPTGRLGAGPYAPVSTRPDYQALAQNAFKTALVNYILKNPKANIQGML